MKGKCLAAGKGGIWPTGLYCLYFLKIPFSFSFYSLVGYVENRHFEQRRHLKISLFQGQNINKHTGSSVSRVSCLLFSLQPPALIIGNSSVSYFGLLLVEWVNRCTEFSPLKDFWPFWIQILLLLEFSPEVLQPSTLASWQNIPTNGEPQCWLLWFSSSLLGLFIILPLRGPYFLVLSS